MGSRAGYILKKYLLGSMFETLGTLVDANSLETLGFHGFGRLKSPISIAVMNYQILRNIRNFAIFKLSSFFGVLKVSDCLTLQEENGRRRGRGG